MKKFRRIIFRTNKHNRYSITPLVAAILNRFEDIEVLETKNVSEITQYPATDTAVAFSFMTFDIDSVVEEARYLKEHGYTIIAGGPHTTAQPQEMLKLGFDFVFVGDGEENILRFLEGERPERRIFDGITQRVNLNDFPPICEKKKLFMPIEITRGCPFDCGYCQTPRLAGKIVRHRSIDEIVEYEKISVKHGKTIARFITPNAFGYGSKNGVTAKPEIVDELLSKIKATGVKEIYFGTFPSDVRPESVTDEIVKVVKKYVNHDYVVLGAQSGSDRVLHILRRGHNVEKVEEALEILTANGFYAKVDFIFGFPFETKEDVELTFNFIEKIVKKYNAKIHAHTFMPLPGTPLENIGPGILKDYHYKFLGQLAAQGILDGYWIKQEQLAKKAAQNILKVQNIAKNL